MPDANTAKKCAHDGCGCDARPGSKWCSEYCQKAGSMTELHCNCQHPECR